MRPVVIFAGTIEGRTLSEYLSGRQIPVVSCVATEYGETLLTENAFLTVHAGRMDQEQMRVFIREQDALLVVDATHPYAAEVSENVSRACEAAGREYIRLIRESSAVSPDQAVLVDSVDQAVEYLKGTEGNIRPPQGARSWPNIQPFPAMRSGCLPGCCPRPRWRRPARSLDLQGKI